MAPSPTFEKAGCLGKRQRALGITSPLSSNDVSVLRNFLRLVTGQHSRDADGNLKTPCVAVRYQFYLGGVRGVAATTSPGIPAAGVSSIPHSFVPRAILMKPRSPQSGDHEFIAVQ